MQIRLATLDDVHFLDALFRRHGAWLPYIPKHIIVGYIQNSCCLVGEQDGVLVGALTFSSRRDGIVVVHEIVSELYGTASALFEEMTDMLGSANVQTKVVESNEGGIRFFEKLGFTHVRTESSKRRKVRVYLLKRGR